MPKHYGHNKFGFFSFWNLLSFLFVFCCSISNFEHLFLCNTFGNMSKDHLTHFSKIFRNITIAVQHSFKRSLKSVESLDFSRLYGFYDKLTGLDQVRVAHVRVLEAESLFIKKQSERRACQVEVFRIEEARNNLNHQLDSIERSDDRFIPLVTKLHEISRNYKQARDKLAEIEVTEQILFEQFSGTLRHSQAEERVQSTRMRQWTVGLSLLAGLIGFGTTWIRFRKYSPEVILSTSYGEEVGSSFQELNMVLQSTAPTLQTTLKNLVQMQSQLNQFRETMNSLNERSNQTLKTTFESLKSIQAQLNQSQEKMDYLNEHINRLPSTDIISDILMNPFEGGKLKKTIIVITVFSLLAYAFSR